MLYCSCSWWIQCFLLKKTQCFIAFWEKFSPQLGLYDMNKMWMRYWWPKRCELMSRRLATCHRLSCHLVSFLVHFVHLFLHLVLSNIDNLSAAVLSIQGRHNSLKNIIKSGLKKTKQTKLTFYMYNTKIFWF